MRSPSVAGCWLLLAVALGFACPALCDDYSDDFESYPEGSVPTGWAYLFGPGRMAVLDGRFAQSTTTFDNYCYYAYTPRVFGNGIYRMKINVSPAYNTIVIWRSDVTPVTGSTNSIEIVFNTSPLLESPTGHTRLQMYLGGTRIILADDPNPFFGTHDLEIEDQGSRVSVRMDNEQVFDVDVSSVLPAGLLILNPGDWGSGSWFDDVQILTSPTPTRGTSFGEVKSRFR